jgi:lipooligosaccharide transport system permease protein
MPPGPPRNGGVFQPSGLAIRAFRCWLTVYRRIWRSSIWSSVLGPLFYLGAMGFGLGSLVNARGTASLGGVSYLAFVAPAILASGAMNSAMGEASYPVFGSIKWNKIYVGMQASPLRPSDIFRGHLMFMTMRIAMNAALVIVFMCAFRAARSPWVVLAWPVAVLTGLAFAAPIAAWAVTVTTENSFAYVFRFAIMPLMLFSGTFFPLSQLPYWLRLLAYATPLWHGVALCRELSLGSWLRADLPVTLGHVAYLAAFAGFGIWAGERTYRRRLYV